MSKTTVPLGEYLFRRLKDLGIYHILGVPGDFNLTLLDHIYNVSDLKWVGCCNELNAAYAADGYARVRGLPGVLITTYGVGELSAMNGVAGAYAEHAGMIHIVGTTARLVQAARIMIHHTLEANPDHTAYQSMSAPIRATSTFLTDESTMASEIDRVIVTGVQSKLPVYIFVPTDVVDIPLDASRLESPLDVEIKNEKAEVEELVLKKIIDAIKSAKTPCILADVLAMRHNAKDLTRRLADATTYPAYSTFLSKGVIDETSDSYSGLYNGSMSLPGIKQAVEQTADVVINIGPHLSDSNTGGFSREISENKLIILHPHYCSVLGQLFEGLHFRPVLEKLVREIESNPTSFQKGTKVQKYETPILDDSKTGPLHQSYIWQRLGKFTGKDDIVFVEAGTAQFGMPDAPIASNVQMETQVFWSSIGYSVGATLGALIAAQEMKKKGRVILIVGDGSLQMTVQEIGTYIRNGFTPTIFLINNDGYTIEREIHGPKQQYNDISLLWDYKHLLEFFGARGDTGVQGKTYQAKTVEDIEAVLKDSSFVDNKHIQLCEIFLGKFDSPRILTGQIKLHRERLKKAAETQRAKLSEQKGAGMGP